MIPLTEEEVKEIIIKEILSVVNDRRYADILVGNLIIRFEHDEEIAKTAVKYGYVCGLDFTFDKDAHILTAKGVETFSFLFI